MAVSWSSWLANEGVKHLCLVGWRARLAWRSVCLTASLIHSWSVHGWDKRSGSLGRGEGESCFRLLHLVSTLRITEDNSFLLNLDELHYRVMESLRGGTGSQSDFSLAFQRLASLTLPIALVPFCRGDV